MTPYHEAPGVTVYHGDCLEVLPTLPAESVDAIVTDPPYGLGFMGVKWDTYGDGKGRGPASKAKFDQVGGNSHARKPGGVELIRKKENIRFQAKATQWAEAMLRVAKPGAHLVAFGGTRTFHRLTCAIEDAGWEIRDCLSWLYGSGFPKSLDVSKAIDKAAGVERTEVVGTKLGRPGMANDGSNQRSGFDAAFGGEACGVLSTDITAPATDAAKQWAGWGTALKPGWESIILARKPLVGTVAANVQRYGTGALNVDGCRIEAPDGVASGGANTGRRFADGSSGFTEHERTPEHPAGRWPANVVLDEEAARLLDEQGGERGSYLPAGAFRPNSEARTIFGNGQRHDVTSYGDSGGASRFFYTAKASRAERNLGCDDTRNTHPTVKPLDLMRWLCRLVTPPGGVILDPFAGSGSTLVAGRELFHPVIGIEREASYCEIMVRRLSQGVLDLGGAA